MLYHAVDEVGRRNGAATPPDITAYTTDDERIVAVRDASEWQPRPHFGY